MKSRIEKVASVLALILMTGFCIIVSLKSEPKRENDIIILYTNDVHCGIEDNIGYAGVVSYKESLKETTPYVTLVDCGDAIQGEFIGLTSQGSYIVDIMNEAGYDFAILGNHEFDYGMDKIGELIGLANATYLGCNIQYTGMGENKLSGVKPYEMVSYGDTCVAFIGVTTPESISSSTPTYFMEGEEYVYGFSSKENGQELYKCVQGYIDECKRKGADYVVLLTHLGDGEEYAPHSSVELIKATEGVNAVLDGHSHSVIEERIVKNKKGQDVVLSSAGSKIENIGQLVIDTEGKIHTRLIGEYEEKDARIQTYIDVIEATYEEDLKQVVAFAENKLSGFSEEGIRLVRNRETTIGNFCADAYRYVTKADIAIVNGGGIRADLPKGDITYEDLYAVHPFGNTLCMVEATGAEILDCLEMCYRMVLPEESDGENAIGEDGGFQQVSGIKFKIDVSVAPSVKVDENDMFVAVEGERRVKDVFVLNDNGEYEPLKEDKIYTIASHNYLMKEGGSGCMMFADNVFLIDEGMADYQALITYMQEALNGKVDKRYEKTEGRIQIFLP